MLSGSLDLFTITDVLRLVSGNKVNGHLRVNRPERSGTFRLSDGSVVGVSAAPDADADEDAAIDMALELYDGTGGDFLFEPAEDVGGPLDLAVEDLVARLDARRQEWEAVREAIGSVDTRLRLAGEPAEDSVTVSAAEWRLLALAAPGRSARAIASAAGLRTYEVAGTLSELARRGLVAADEAEPASADEDDDADVVEIAIPAGPSAEDDEPVVAAAPEPEEKEEPAAEVDEAADEEERDEPAASTDGETGEDEEGDADPIQLLRELGGSSTTRKRPRLLTREEQRMRLRR